MGYSTSCNGICNKSHINSNFVIYNIHVKEYTSGLIISGTLKTAQYHSGISSSNYSDTLKTNSVMH